MGRSKQRPVKGTKAAGVPSDAVVHGHWHLPLGAACIAATLVLQIIRGWGYIQVPQFWGEEGRDFFKDAFDHGPASLLHTCGGYLHIFPRIAAVLTTLLPLEAAPSLFMVAALLGQAMLYWLIWSPRLHLPTLARGLLTVCVAFNPNGGEVLVNLTNVQWYTGPALFFVLLRDAPTRSRELAADLAWLFVLGTTGPYLVLFLPLLGIARACDKRQLWSRLEQLRWGGALGIAAVHMAFWNLAERQYHVASQTADSLDAWAGALGNLVLPFYLSTLSPWMRGGVSWPWVMLAVPTAVLTVVLLFPTRQAWRQALRLGPLLCGAVCYAAGMWEARDKPSSLHPFGDGQRSFFILYLTIAWGLGLTVADVGVSVLKRRAAAACLAMSAIFCLWRYDLLMHRPDFRYPDQVRDYQEHGHHLFRQPPAWVFELDRGQLWYGKK